MEEKKKQKKPEIILESKTSVSIFFYPVLFLLITLYYTFFIEKSKHLLILLPIIFIFITYFFSVYGKKILLTSKKIYIYNRNKKIISWLFLEDLDYIKYEQTKINKIFKSGTLIIINKKKEMYSYNHLSNVADIYQKILDIIEDELQKIDPNYEKVFTNKNNNVDSLTETSDTINE